ncbi:MAG: PAS domain S-box protein [Leptolyngbyaceae cyanobacterium MO_188.B28]|nr:PAS domain S-box protein [Leptolyngbyaceae cyanobacterium MO_188.B28]
MANRTVSFRLPATLIKSIEAQSKVTGRSKTSLIIEALNQAIDPQTSPSNSATTSALQQQIQELKDQVKTLSGQLDTLRQNTHPNGHLLDDITFLKQAAASFQAWSPSASLEFSGDLLILDANDDLTSTAEMTDGLELPENYVEGEPPEAIRQLITRMIQQAHTLDQILSASPDLVIVYDRIGRYTYANAAAARTLGFEQRHLLGKTSQELGFSSATTDRLTAQREAVFTTGQSINDEISFPTVNGIRDYEYIFSPIRGADGRIDLVVFTGRDITERKQAEEALRASETKYRNLFEFANDAILIIDPSNNRFLNVNQNAASRLGYTRQELCQLSIHDIKSPASKVDVEAMVQDLRANGSVVFEHIHRRKDGSDMSVEISSRLIEYGDRLAFQAFVRDITARKQIEALLQQQSTAMESSIDGMAILDDQEHFIYLNKAHLKIHGYDDDRALVGQSWRILYDESEQRRFEQEILPKFRQTGRWRGETVGKRWDGGKFHQEVSLTAIPGGGLSFVVRDITERKRSEAVRMQAEMALQQERDLLSQMVATSPAGIIFVNCEGQISFANACAEEILGWPKEEIIGRAHNSLAWRMTHVDGQTMADEEFPFRRVVNTGQSISNMQIAIAKPNGDPVLLSVNGAPLFDTTGQLNGVVFTLEDITESKSAEAVLRESESRFRIIADTAPVMIWMSDHDKCYSYFNQGWLEFTGRTLEQELGEGWRQGVHPDDLPTCLEAYAAAFSAHRTFQMEYRLRRADGEYRRILDTGKPRFHPNGNFAGYIGSCIDITDLPPTQTLEGLGNGHSLSP